MSKEEYYKWIEENDTYPEHSHQWIVRTYTGGELFYRNFGTFETKKEAKEFIVNYKKKYTTKGYTINGRDWGCDWYKIVDLREWTE